MHAWFHVRTGDWTMRGKVLGRAGRSAGLCRRGMWEGHAGLGALRYLGIGAAAQTGLGMA